MIDINTNILESAEKYTLQTKRKIYITPSNFIELVKVFINLMKI